MKRESLENWTAKKIDELAKITDYKYPPMDDDEIMERGINKGKLEAYKELMWELIDRSGLI